MSDPIDLFGKKFGRLVVLSKDPKMYRHHQLWECRCDCGKVLCVRSDMLRSGKTKSCGCYHDSAAWVLQKDRQLAVEKSRYRQAIVKQSRERGWLECISLDEYRTLIHQPCHYCGTTGSNIQRDHLRTGKVISGLVVRYNGIDRVDSGKGYVSGNVVPCCKYCNKAKSNMTLDEFYEWLARAYNHSFSMRAAIHA